jgi:hypothetical protein
MPSMRRPSGVSPLAAALVWLLIAAPASAQPKAAVALVLDVAGGRIAGIEPFREIPADTTVTVPPGVRLVFQHYGSCRKFTLVGGTATFRADGVEISDTRPSDVRAACPRRITLKGGGASAGVVMRSLGPPRVAVSPRPEFVIVGPRAAEFSALRVRKGDEVIVEHRLAGGRSLPWPPDAPSLAPGASYEIELVPTSADGRPVVVGIRTETSGVHEAMTLVSAE